MSTTTMLVGALVFTQFHGLCAAVFRQLFGWQATSWYALSLPISSLAAHYYARELRRFAAGLRVFVVLLRAGSSAPVDGRALLTDRVDRGGTGRAPAGHRDGEGSSFVKPWFLRVFLGTLSHAAYRIEIIHPGRIPRRSGAPLVSNHVFFLDPLLILASVERLVRFLLPEEVYERPMLKPFLRLLRVIPLPPQQDVAASASESLDSQDQSMFRRPGTAASGERKT